MRCRSAELLDPFPHSGDRFPGQNVRLKNLTLVKSEHFLQGGTLIHLMLGES